MTTSIMRHALMVIPHFRKRYEEEEEREQRMNGAIARIKQAADDIRTESNGKLERLARSIEETAARGEEAMRGDH